MSAETWTWVLILVGAVFAALATRANRPYREANNIARVRAGRGPAPNWGGGMVVLILLVGVLLMVFVL